MIRPCSILVLSLSLLAAGLAAAPARADLLGDPAFVERPGGTLEALVHDRDGRLVAAGRDGTTLWTATSADEGRSWSEPLVLLEGGDPGPPALAADGAGRVFLAVRDGATVRLFLSDDHGATFEEEDPLRDGLAGFVPGDPAIAGNPLGRAVVAWFEEDGETTRREVHAVFLGGHGERSGPVRVSAPAASETAGDPVVAIGEADEAFVAWAARPAGGEPGRLRLARTLDGGRTWSRLDVPTGGPAGHDESSPALVVGRGDRRFALGLAWVDDRDGDPRVLVTSSSRAGDPGTWLDEPTRPDGGACAGGGQAHPRLCLGAAGLVVAFTCGTAHPAALVSNASGDLGASWEDAEAVPVDDEGASDVPWFDLRCDPGPPGDVHVALVVLPRRGRQHHVSLRRPMEPVGEAGGFEDSWRAWEPRTEPPDFLPERHGERCALAADARGRAFLGVDLDDDARPATNGTTGETRLDRDDPGGQRDDRGIVLAAGDGAFALAAWRAESGAGGTITIRFALSPDRGGAWLDAGSLPAGGDPGDPAVSAAPGGVAVALWPARDGPSRAVRAARSATHGFTWEAAGTVPGSTGDPREVVLCAADAADGPVFHAAWLDGADGGARVFHARSTGGDSWEAAVRVDTDPAGGHAAAPVRLACDGEGHVAVAWLDRREATARVRARCSDDGGAPGSWSAEDVPLDDGSGEPAEPDLAADGADGFLAAWTETRDDDSLVLTARACGGCGSWSAPVEVTRTSRGALRRPRGAKLADGKALVAWDAPDGLWVAGSTDHGENWGPAIRLGATGDPGTEEGRDPATRVFLGDHGEAAAGIAYAASDGSVDVRAWRARNFGLDYAWEGPFPLAPLGGLGHDGSGASPVPAGRPAFAFVPPDPAGGGELLAAWAAERSGGMGRADVAAARWRVPSGVPPEVRDLRFDPDRETVRWHAVASDLVVRWHGYRGIARSGSPPGTLRCRFSALEAPTFRDPDEPFPGRAFLYLVTAVGPGGEGPAGTSLAVDSCEPDPPSCP